MMANAISYITLSLWFFYLQQGYAATTFALGNLEFFNKWNMAEAYISLHNFIIGEHQILSLTKILSMCKTNVERNINKYKTSVRVSESARLS